jgi:hypothetical protein
MEPQAQDRMRHGLDAASRDSGRQIGQTRNQRPSGH